MKRLDTLLLLAIGISFGIAFGTFFPVNAFDMMAIVGIAVIACGFSLIGRPLFLRILFFLLALLLGISLGSRSFSYWEHLPLPDASLVQTVVTVSPSVEKSFFQESEVSVEHYEGNAYFFPREKILLRESVMDRRRFGDRLTLACELKQPDEYVDISGHRVAYRLLLASRGIGYLCEKPTRVTMIGRSDDWILSLRHSLFSVREKFVTALERSLPAGEAALSLGMLIGADEGFSEIEKNLFIRTGVTHVTAVSGYNITLIGILLFFLAIVLGFYRRGASMVAIIGIIVYVLLVGAPASAVRAGVMGALFLLSLAIGRPGSGFRLWLLALASMLFWNPLLLRFDIGFELSYLATLALLLYASVRERLWMPKNIAAIFFTELLYLSLFVEWLVAPVILLRFGIFSSVSILANVFLVPIVPFLMLFAFLAAIVGLFIPGGVFFLNWPTFFLAHSFICGAEFLSGLPGSFFSDLSVSIWWVVLWYIVTGHLFWFFSNSGRTAPKAERPSV